VRAGGTALEVTVDHAEARAALAAAARRSRDLVAGIVGGGRPTSGLAWSLSETAAHMVVGARAFADSLTGDLAVWEAHLPATPEFADRLRAVTGSTLAAEPERDTGVLAGRLVDAVERFLGVSAGLPPDHAVATPWYGRHATLSLRTATSLLLGEQLVHGRDLAVTLRRPWPVSAREALLVVPAITAMMPRAVRAERTRDLDVTVAFHLRGGPGFAVRLVRGTARLEPLGARRPDCHLRFDPVAYVLVGYGRITPWAAVARGGAVAYGRRPWVGFRFKSFFHDP
jgi:hypothetical protein